jgi:hypothetical protein
MFERLFLLKWRSGLLSILATMFIGAFFVDPSIDFLIKSSVKIIETTMLGVVLLTTEIPAVPKNGENLKLFVFHFFWYHIVTSVLLAAYPLITVALELNKILYVILNSSLLILRNINVSQIKWS